MLLQIKDPAVTLSTASPKPWRFMVFGGVGVGKTTLLRVLEGKDPGSAEKSQMIDYSGWGIDIPGEYAEMRHYRKILVTTAFDAQLVLVVQDASSDRTTFPPDYFRLFPQPVIGVVTKVDHPQADYERARSILAAAGVTGEVFCVSAWNGYGISTLRDFLLSQNF
ncbi:MAG: EutP/PduV family microcompartment system protein [Chloroflexota bacterium]